MRADAARLAHQLRALEAALAAWLDVQRAWLRLEPVFAAPDIQRQLPAEARAFAHVDRAFRDAARRAREHPDALAAGGAWLAPMERCRATLEEVAKALDEYLEAKRGAFPRCARGEMWMEAVDADGRSRPPAFAPCV